ncbi:MAG: type II toxin-antitoxin system YoeB family toxin [Defluviitaleaceae bacterium]|nr:type II toxin-antitoxin system YoeB family toxin [Defluviitaleaceae bacterium]
MKLTFTRQGLKEYKSWETSGPETVEKIDELIADIFDKGYLNGIGKPEKLKHYKDPVRFSRVISQGDRLVYCRNGEDLLIISCKGHFDDK